MITRADSGPRPLGTSREPDSESCQGARPINSENWPSVPQVRIFAGRADQVREARHWLAGLLLDHPLAKMAELVASELATNAIRHTMSGWPGGTFTMELVIDDLDKSLYLCVTDEGSNGEPLMAPVNDDDTAGRGLLIVFQISRELKVARLPDGGHSVLAILSE